MWVYTAYITLKNGRRLYASECGKKAFCFWADDENNDTKPKKPIKVENNNDEK